MLSRSAVGTALISLLISVMHMPAIAQDTIALYGQVDAPLSRFIYTDTQTFDIVALATSSKCQGAIEFVMTELTVLYPGVFKTDTRRANDTPLDLGDNDVGEYLIAYGDCLGPGPVEAVRVTYLDADGSLIGPDTVLSVRGFQPGDSRPSSCGGLPCYVSVSSDNNKYVLALEAWSEYGMPDNQDLAGAVVLNPSGFPVASEATSLGCLKARF